MTVPCLSSVTRTDTTIVPLMVFRALDGTSGITSLMGEGGPAGLACISSSTGSTAGAIAMVSGSGTAGAVSGSLHNRLTPSPSSTAKTNPRMSSSAPLRWRGGAGAGGAPSGGSLIRITSRRVRGVSGTCALSSISSACATKHCEQLVSGLHHCISRLEGGLRRRAHGQPQSDLPRIHKLPYHAPPPTMSASGRAPNSSSTRTIMTSNIKPIATTAKDAIFWELFCI